MKLRKVLPYTLILLFLGWCFIAFRSDVEQVTFAPVWAAKGTVLLAAFLSLLNYGLRIARWSLFLTRIGHVLPAGFTGLTYLAGFAYTLSPGKVGELMRGRYYQKRGIPLSDTAAALFVERMLDFLAMLVLAFLAFAAVSAYHYLMWGAAAGIALLLAAMGVIPWTRAYDWAMHSPMLPPRIRNALLGCVRTLLSAQVLLRPTPLIAGLALGLVAWGAEGVGLMVIAGLAPGGLMDWVAAISIYAISIIVGALSFLPGGLGSTEAVMAGLLVAQGYPLPEAILLTLVCRLLTLWLAVALGWAAVAWLRLPFSIAQKDASL